MDYEDYWAADHSQGVPRDPRQAVLLRVIDPGSTVVEIGCGDGTMLAFLTSHLHISGKGYDVSARAVAKAKARGVDADIRDATVQGADESEHYHYVLIADCLEHLPSPETLLARLRGKFSRAILISVPNSCYWRYRFRVLFGSFMVQWVAHPGEHLRFWSIRDMYWWLGQLGYDVRAAYPTWGIPILKHLWPSMFAQNVLYVVADNTLSHPDARSPRPNVASGRA